LIIPLLVILLSIVIYWTIDLMTVIFTLYYATALIVPLGCLMFLYRKKMDTKKLLTYRNLSLFVLFIVSNYFLGFFYNNKIVDFEKDMNELAAFMSVYSGTLTFFEGISNFFREVL
jgi:glucan phosphoethanolaminetransferase (alkaline phosphatase superfamily)